MGLEHNEQQLKHEQQLLQQRLDAVAGLEKREAAVREATEVAEAESNRVGLV